MTIAHHPAFGLDRPQTAVEEPRWNLHHFDMANSLGAGLYLGAVAVGLTVSPLLTGILGGMYLVRGLVGITKGV